MPARKCHQAQEVALPQVSRLGDSNGGPMKDGWTGRQEVQSEYRK